MASFTVTDPTTGKKVTLTGDSAPTEQELEQVFSAVGDGSIRAETGLEKTGRVAGEFAKNLGRNAEEFINPVKIAEGLGNTVKEGLLDIPKDVASSSVNVLKGLAKTVTGEQAPSEMGNTIMDTPIVKRTKAMTGTIAKDPAGFAYKHPLDAASILLAPVMPFLSEGVAPKVASLDTAEASPGILRRGAAKVISTAFGASEDAILEKMKNPAPVDSAFTHPEIADHMVNSIKNLKETVSQLDTEAMKTLRTSPFIQDGAIPKTDIFDAIKSARRDLGGVFSEDAQKAAGALKRVSEKFKKLRSTVSEQQAKDLIQQLDADIDWSNPNASRTNEALVGVRARVDGLLKKQNHYYAEAMKPVAEAVDVMNEMQKKFGISKKTAKGFEVTDQTVGKIKSALKEDRLGTQKLLDRFQNLTGEDVTSKIKNANVAAAFEGSGTNGSRRAVIGGAVGSLSGYLMGLPASVSGAIGAIAGGFADIYGKRVAGRLAATLSIPEMRRYIPAFQQAAIKGPRFVALLHAKLLEHDPDYTGNMTEAIRGVLSDGSARKQK